MDWETYNIDAQPPAGEPAAQSGAPSPEHADGGEAASTCEESVQGAPERSDSPHAEGADASAPEVIVIMDIWRGFYARNANG